MLLPIYHVLVAQWIAHQTSDLGVEGSSPSEVIFFEMFPTPTPARAPRLPEAWHQQNPLPTARGLAGPKCTYARAVCLGTRCPRVPPRVPRAKDVLSFAPICSIACAFPFCHARPSPPRGPPLCIACCCWATGGGGSCGRMQACAACATGHGN